MDTNLVASSYLDLVNRLVVHKLTLISDRVVALDFTCLGSVRMVKGTHGSIKLFLASIVKQLVIDILNRQVVFVA